MFTRLYNLRRPAEVRELLASRDEKLILLCALIYSCNFALSKGLFAHRQSVRKNISAIRKESVTGESELYRQIYRRKRANVRTLCKSMGCIATVDFSGRISKIQHKSLGRKKGRIPGGISNISQKALFVFADLYSEDALINILMFNEEK
jgi:hypothetical protein